MTMLEEKNDNDDVRRRKNVTIRLDPVSTIAVQVIMVITMKITML